jgi:hypothetical protein
MSDYVIADRAYDAEAFIAFVVQRGRVPAIPPRKRRKEPGRYDT